MGVPPRPLRRRPIRRAPPVRLPVRWAVRIARSRPRRRPTSRCPRRPSIRGALTVRPPVVRTSPTCPGVVRPSRHRRGPRRSAPPGERTPRPRRPALLPRAAPGADRTPGRRRDAPGGRRFVPPRECVLRARAPYARPRPLLERPLRRHRLRPFSAAGRFAGGARCVRPWDAVPVLQWAGDAGRRLCRARARAHRRCADGELADRGRCGRRRCAYRVHRGREPLAQRSRGPALPAHRGGRGGGPRRCRPDLGPDRRRPGHRLRRRLRPAAAPGPRARRLPAAPARHLHRRDPELRHHRRSALHQRRRGRDERPERPLQQREPRPPYRPDAPPLRREEHRRRRLHDAQRASWTISVLTDAPAVVYAVSGWADGRGVDTPEPADEAMAPGATTALAQAGLGNEAKGLADRVERALRKNVGSAAKQPS